MVTLTQSAAVHVQTMLSKRGHGIGLRLATKKSGCSGFAYAVDYADAIGENEIAFDTRGVKVIVDRADLANLDGTEIDFKRTSLLNEGFELRNPNVKETCGCGESFGV